MHVKHTTVIVDTMQRTAEWKRRFITVREIADLWGVSQGTVMRAAADGEIPSERTLRGKRRYVRDQVLAHYESRHGQEMVKGE